MSAPTPAPATLPAPAGAGSARRAFFAAAVALLAAVPFIGVYPVFMMNALCFAIFACGFNLLLGFTGLLSFGHAAFFGGAAYAAGWLVRETGWPPEVGLLAGTAVGAVTGLAVGAIAIRRQGIYFAMITLALAQMVYFFCLQAPFTGGEDGLQGVPRGKLFGLVPLGDDRVAYYVVLAVFLAAYLFIRRIVHSPFGQVLKAIRENEPRAVSLGYDADRYKLLAFTLSAAFAGLAGSLKTLVLGFATLSDVHWAMSGEVILMTLLGGLGTFVGPVVGAFSVIGLQNFLPDAAWSSAVLIGLALAVLMLVVRGHRLASAPMLATLALAAATGALKTASAFGALDGWPEVQALMAAKVGAWVAVLIGVVFVLCVLLFRSGLAGELGAWWARRAAPDRVG